MSDRRRDYDQAGCASGCRDTMAGATVLLALAIALLVRLVRKGRNRG